MTNTGAPRLHEMDCSWIWRQLADHSPVGLALIDDGSATVVESNKAFARLLDYDPAELPGLPAARLFSPANDKGEISLLGKSGQAIDATVVRRRSLSPAGIEVSVLLATPGPGSDFGLLDQRARLMADIFEHSAEAILITDVDNRIVEVNPAFTALTGYRREEVLGANPKLLASGRTSSSQYREMWTALAGRGHWQGEVWDKRKDGSVYPKWLSISTAYDDDGCATNFIATFTDLTDRQVAAERISHLAHHDPLTDLLNRISLEKQMDRALAAARRDRRLVAIALIDMDRFKDINDTLGHHVGDGLLIHIAERLKSSVRASDFVARLGGDEFVIVLTELDNLTSIANIADKVLRHVGEQYNVDGYSLHSTPSIGIAVFPNDGEDPVTLLRHADAAMYHAKAEGRNNYQFFDDSMNLAATRRLEMENMLRQALAETTPTGSSQFELHFQPQLDARSGRITGLEALARWKHPELGYIPPTRFIPVAEETGLIQPLGDWIFWQACRQLREFKNAGFADLRIAINISCQQLRHEGLTSLVRGALAAFDLQPSDLELEITESTAMQNPPLTLAILEQLKEMGVTLAMDDFGTGYSSLSYLKQLPIHRLKLDRSFVQEVDTSSRDTAICSASIVLGHELGLELVAEGVETVAQRDQLRRLGCDVLQGFYYSVPQPADDMIDFLRRWSPSASVIPS